jgi:hypothetical protein
LQRKAIIIILSILGVFDNGNFSRLTSAIAVPWERDALSVLGSSLLFAFELFAKGEFSRPLQK